MNKIIDFPSSRNASLQKAIELFKHDSADLALSEFKKLVDGGCDEAYSFVGNLYECGGKNVERDYEKARFYYEQSLDRYGAVAAYLGLIRIYYYGLGVRQDFCKALEYCLVLAEETEHPYANFYIGKMYMNGECVGKDLKQSKKFFEKSWEKGYVFALTCLGLVEGMLGNRFKEMLYKAKAGVWAFIIARKDINDQRIREI